MVVEEAVENIKSDNASQDENLITASMHQTPPDKASQINHAKLIRVVCGGLRARAMPNSWFFDRSLTRPCLELRTPVTLFYDVSITFAASSYLSIFLHSILGSPSSASKPLAALEHESSPSPHQRS